MQCYQYLHTVAYIIYNTFILIYVYFRITFLCCFLLILFLFVVAIVAVSTWEIYKQTQCYDLHTVAYIIYNIFMFFFFSNNFFAVFILILFLFVVIIVLFFDLTISFSPAIFSYSCLVVLTTVSYWFNCKLTLQPEQVFVKIFYNNFSFNSCIKTLISLFIFDCFDHFEIWILENLITVLFSVIANSTISLFFI